MTSAAQLESLLDSIPDPETGKPLKSGGQLRSCQIEPDRIQLEIGLSSWSSPLKKSVVEQVEAKLKSAAGGRKIEINFVDQPRKAVIANTLGLECKSVIAVAAGKGGVGKSTVATCLALALQRFGAKVGLLDADVYGPSVPQLTGVSGHPMEVDGKIQPVDYNGMPVMSIGFMVPPDQAVIWRGPMLHSAVTKFLRDTAWGALDYLIIDMPPGTGDVALTLSQLMPIQGAVIVCTPQRVALLDAVKAVGMFQRVKIPIVGVVENMSTFVCPDNGQRYDIFGTGGARQYASDAGLAFLGELPIQIPLREHGDRGTSRAAFDDPNIAPYLEGIAVELTRELGRRNAENPPKASLPVIG